ncbi:type IV toxin-antitoxin system AbiEi family antitoxin [Mumia quercus]|uniref:type IV toxin-antitoxin system AbiEi family antitoxin n=1 Tax=Mumia quercus TaxID=2976125 RepID=UPI0021CF43CD|nr:type IV toxin-antitoxin system AbiEi family antitoxin [Mumia quercus]
MDSLTERIVDVLRDVDLVVDLPDGTDADHPDLVVRIPTSHGESELWIDVKDRSTPIGLAEIHSWETEVPRPYVLAVPYVSPEQGRRYRAAGIQYVDSGGNAYLSQPGYYLHVEGRRPTVHGRPRRRGKRPSTNAAGLRVVFVLLVSPRTAAMPYERIATLAQVSKGSATNAMDDLRDLGFLVGDRSDRRIVDVARLRRSWVDNFARDLLPRLEQTEVAGPDPSWWATSPLAPRDGVVGGGTALAHLGAPLRPERTVVYGEPPWREARRVGRLSRDGAPNVILRERFWSPELRPDDRFVPSLLAYADGLASDDPREVEVARAAFSQDVNDDVHHG